MKKRRPRAAPDLAALERSVAAFLDAAGLDRSDPNLRETPARVARAWVNEFLDGYSKDPAEILAGGFPAPSSQGGELVVVTDLRFHAMCPHHLLPYEGRAHVAYVPSGRVVGFGKLAALVDCFAHRLILQEDLARAVAKALSEHLGSEATACVVEAAQSCMRVRGAVQVDARTHAQAYEGLLQDDPVLRRELWARIPPAGRSAP